LVEEKRLHREDTAKASHATLVTLSLAALGVVYGDIGTSPLYALREALSDTYGIPVTPVHVLGVLSLIFWSLILVISTKYLMFVMRADNRGEGGILALTALITPLTVQRGGGRWLLVMLGLFGTALLYGDGMITPAISVLSAVEGLTVATPIFAPYVRPVAIGILVGLFLLQHRGTGTVGKLFGPVILLWFVMLAILGVIQLVHTPGVLAAINPLYGLTFFVHNTGRGFWVLGSVFLVVTGGEALYADMGHFGKRPIQLAWFMLVLPALLLNYFGQGALVIHTPEAVDQPFYRMIPGWGLYPMVLLATAATVIASQALISGAFSLTMQAVQLGYSPRLEIDHTSAQAIGQVYVPAINWTLMVACIGLVLGFRSSSNLAAAYGVAVTMTMVITAVLLFVVARERWQWPLWGAGLLCGGFLVIDAAFLVANLSKIPQGGWFPLIVAACVFTLMSTWKRGRAVVAAALRVGEIPAKTFVRSIAGHSPTRVPGTAVYLHSRPGHIPPALLTNLKHNHVLHERVALLSVETSDVPRVLPARRIESESLGAGFYQIRLYTGFMEAANVPQILANRVTTELNFDPLDTTYILGRETLIVTAEPGMPLWCKHLFVLMARNARNATFFFGLPPERIIEVGGFVEF
jgi:KUP system potassium uptake protein